MKTKNRFLKAVAVILILGIGIVNNMNFSYETRNDMDQVFTFTEKANDKTTKKESSLDSYTKLPSAIFVTALKHIVSNH